MFLRAGLLSLVLLLASRILGLARESAQAAAFGATGLGDLAVLMFSLPDWITSVVAGGALSYALLPWWARQGPQEVAVSQRWVGRWLLAVGVLGGLLLATASGPALAALAGGLPPPLRDAGVQAMLWSAAMLPLALGAALATTRLQHERDFIGMYAANLFVNAVLVGTLIALAVAHLSASPERLVALLGLGLLVAMGARAWWLRHRQRPFLRAAAVASRPALPGVGLWWWAALAAGLPLALPFAARSLASRGGEGGLATFNYAWKLVELPLMLAIQLVATLALPAIARALAQADEAGRRDAATAIRSGFALAWVLGCAAAAGLTLAAPAVAQLLFGWGRMQPEALVQVAAWSRQGAWTLLPQAVIAVGTAVLAAQARMAPVALAYAVALAVLLAAGAMLSLEGGALMVWLQGLFWAVAVVVLLALRGDLRQWLPLRAWVAGAGVLAAAQGVHMARWLDGAPLAGQFAAAVAAALVTLAAAYAASADLRASLRR